MWLNSYMGTPILSSVLKHYRFPEATFVGSQPFLDELRTALKKANRENPTQDLDTKPFDDPAIP